jgi:hypothetical protein
MSVFNFLPCFLERAVTSRLSTWIVSGTYSVVSIYNAVLNQHVLHITFPTAGLKQTWKFISL